MRRLLVIDDEPFVRDALKRVLDGAVFQVESAAEAESGIALLRSRGAELLIIDVIMPGMDGVTAIGRIRAEFPALKIIAISGGGNFGLSEYQPDAIATQAYLAAARKAGADGILGKPFESRELKRLIDQVMGEAPAAAH